MFNKQIRNDLDKLGIDQKTFCAFPFFQVAIKEWTKNKPNLIAPCCNAVGIGENPLNFDMDKLRKDFSFKNVFNSPEFDKIRQDLLKGIKTKACTYCWQLEEEGSYSPRTPSVDFFYDAIGGKYLAQYIENPLLTSIDTNFDNNCNLRCRMCSPNNSYKIKKDFNALVKQNIIPPVNYVPYDDNPPTLSERARQPINITKMTEETFNELKELSFTLRGIKIAGGEPTVSKYFWEWIDHIEKYDLKKHITMHITTNGTKFNKKFLETIKGFKMVEFIISIDAVGDVYDYIRYPFSWEKIKRNVERLCDLQLPNIVINIVYISTSIGLSSVPQLLEWCQSLSMPVQVDVNLFVRPNNSPLSPRWLPKDLLTLYIEEIRKSILHKDINITMKTEVSLENLTSYLTEPINIEKQRELKRDLLILDGLRKQNYQDYLDPHMVKFLNSIGDINGI